MNDPEREKWSQRLAHQSTELKNALVMGHRARAWHVVGQLESFAALIREGVSAFGTMGIHGRGPERLALANVGIDEPWSLLSSAQRLADFARHMLTEQSYDGHGHEELSEAEQAVRRFLDSAELVKVPTDDAVTVPDAILVVARDALRAAENKSGVRYELKQRYPWITDAMLDDETAMAPQVPDANAIAVHGPSMVQLCKTLAEEYRRRSLDTTLGLRSHNETVAMMLGSARDVAAVCRDAHAELLRQIIAWGEDDGFHSASAIERHLRSLHYEVVREVAEDTKYVTCAGCRRTLREGHGTSWCSTSCSCLGAVWCDNCNGTHIDRKVVDDDGRAAIERAARVAAMRDVIAVVDSLVDAGAATMLVLRALLAEAERTAQNRNRGTPAHQHGASLPEVRSAAHRRAGATRVDEPAAPQPSLPRLRLCVATGGRAHQRRRGGKDARKRRHVRARERRRLMIPAPIAAVGFVAFAITVVANIKLAHKRRIGWAIRCLALVVWLGYAILIGSWAHALNSTVSLAVNIYGWVRWAPATDKGES